MKIIINRCFGGAGLNKVAADKYNHGEEYWFDRDDANLIAAIESGENINSDFSKLEVVSIPDEVTDYEINEYDGMESIICVIDGKLYHL